MKELLDVVLNEIKWHQRIAAGALRVKIELSAFPLTYEELAAVKIEYDSSTHRIDELTEEYVILMLI